jgi:EAL domain-containing protein (putative c-di-GMP-specific phosphodiesterase class I)/signal transduction histidine kinase/CheY-like chemotaxis protein
VTLVAGVTTWRDANRDAAVQSQRLASATAVLASLSVQAAASNDRAQAFAAIRAVALMPEVRYARIDAANGALLAETGAGARLSTDARITDIGETPSFWSLMRSHTIQASAPIMQTGRRVGQVVVVGQVSGEAGRVTQSLLISLIAAAIAAGAGLGVAWRLQRGISGPIQALTRAVNQIRETHDYGRHAEVVADDEVAELVGGFNGMMDEIRVRDTALAEHLAGLERTVADRTVDLRAAKEAAEAATNAKSDFLATMSHEIRTPMNGIMVMAEMLAAGEIPPRQRRFAEVIAKSGSSLLAIINDILDFSKIEAGKLELEAAPVDLADVAEDVCSLFWERARAKGLDLAAYVDPATPRLISADEVRLRQVVGNLVNNAIKFTESGGVLVQIEPRAPRGEACVLLRIAVHDTGIGIATDKLESVFGAFSQADQSTTRKFGGTGLGLAICKRLVEAMDGRIGVTSELGKGSIFSVEIRASVIEAAEPWPRLEADRAALALAGPSTRHAMGRYMARAGLKTTAWRGEAHEAGGLLVGDPTALGAAHPGYEAICVGEYGDSAPEALRREGRADAVLVQPFRRRDLKALLSQRRAGAPLREVRPETVAASDRLPRFEGARVLVADDSAVNREVAIEALSRLGIVADVVTDGAQAVEAASATAFDLILMDGSMPEMDGYDAAREIRRRQAEARVTRTPIVALTAHVVGKAAEAWREADMDAVLHKPFTLASLARVLGDYLTPSGDQEALDTPSETLEAAAGDPALLDLHVVAEMETMAANGKADFVERVRRLYRENAPACIASLDDAAKSGDAVEAARAAHALKSMSLNLGARAVSERAARIEGAARDEGRVDAQDVAALDHVLRSTLALLDRRAPLPAAAPPAPDETDDERELLQDLERAIERGELSLAYQPQVDRNGETIVGVEALLRWSHPTRGAVSPALFIPMAERHGLVGRITPWVLARAMAETLDLAPLTISVNASALEFNDPGFVDRVAAIVAEQGFDPHRLEVEITETAILNSESEVRRGIERLREMGIKIALDDFGVGYSSLSHLRLFPFDKLKIDRLFISSCSRDAESATVVHGVISIGRALGMKVVAEGVETETQRKFLKVAGVHAMQGYLTGRPMPVEALRLLVESQAVPRRAATS